MALLTRLSYTYFINCFVKHHLKSKLQHTKKAKQHQQSVNKKQQLQNQNDVVW